MSSGDHSAWSAGVQGWKLLSVSPVGAAAAGEASGSLEYKSISRSAAGCRCLCLFYQPVAVLVNGLYIKWSSIPLW